MLVRLRVASSKVALRREPEPGARRRTSVPLPTAPHYQACDVFMRAL